MNPVAESNTAHGNSAAYADGYIFEVTSYQTRGGSAVRLKLNDVGATPEFVDSGFISAILAKLPRGNRASPVNRLRTQP